MWPKPESANRLSELLRVPWQRRCWSGHFSAVNQRRGAGAPTTCSQPCQYFFESGQNRLLWFDPGDADLFPSATETATGSACRPIASAPSRTSIPLSSDMDRIMFEEMYVCLFFSIC